MPRSKKKSFKNKIESPLSNDSIKKLSGELKKDLVSQMFDGDKKKSKKKSEVEELKNDLKRASI